MLAAAALLVLPALALAAPVELVARADNARYTYYDTSVGLGACGQWHGNNEWTVALNSADWNAAGGGYPSPSCGKQVTISYGGKTAVATIQDECPTCPQGALDLSEGLFNYFADKNLGVIYGSWWMGGNSAPAAPAAPAYVAPTTPTVNTNTNTNNSGTKRLHPGKNSNKCLTSAGAWNGATVSLEDCNGSSNQNWVLQKGNNLVKLDGTNYCLDAGTGPHDGVTSKVWQCYNGLSQQMWNMKDDGHFSTANNQCLDNRGGWNSQSQTWSCVNGSDNQAFWAW